eukprot:10414332-Alexandrium_andersonii.AAC.1
MHNPFSWVGASPSAVPNPPGLPPASWNRGLAATARESLAWRARSEALGGHVRAPRAARTDRTRMFVKAVQL